MYKQTTVTVREDEILNVLGLTSVDYNHTHDKTSPTGIRASFRHFRKGSETIEAKEVAKQLRVYLLEKGIIDETYGRGSLVPTHSWGALDDDDCRPSVYSCYFEIGSKVTIVGGQA